MDRSDRLLIALAAIWLATVASGVAGDTLHASADRVADGQIWLLATSALSVVPILDIPQWLLLCAAVTLVIWRDGPKLWWSVAVAGHIGAALISYAVIGIAVWVGSGSADRAAGQADYGISIVLAATIGAIGASGISVPSTSRKRADRICVALGLTGLIGLIAFSIGWYDIQHIIGFGIGFLLAGRLLDHRVFSWIRPNTDRTAG